MRSGKREVRVVPCSKSALVPPAGPPRGGDGEGTNGPITGQEARQPAQEGDRRQFAADGTVPRDMVSWHGRVKGKRAHIDARSIHASAACV
jgi:hypothetical protein